MLAAIHEHLVPLGVRLPQTEREVVGGYFVWVEVPGALRASEVVRRAGEEENVVVAGGESECTFSLPSFLFFFFFLLPLFLFLFWVGS
jgi:DNA-binding transcriptional MocR family regulator